MFYNSIFYNEKSNNLILYGFGTLLNIQLGFRFLFDRFHTWTHHVMAHQDERKLTIDQEIALSL